MQKIRKAKVTRVIDGDTFEAEFENNRKRVIRLAEVDTPEKGQPNYEGAKQQLESLIAGKTVKLIKTGIGHYGREIAEVKTNSGVNVNRQMKQYKK